MSKRQAGILGNRRIRRILQQKFVDENGILRCTNCGEVATEWDHNVPVEVGGRDVISNILPLCHSCHVAKHSMKPISMRKRPLGCNKGGRPRNVPENYKELLNDFVYCRISREELADRWGLQTTSRTGEKIRVDFVHLSEQIWYREYLEELGIQKVVNKVGQNTRDYEKKGIVGYIIHKSGEKEFLYQQTLAKAE